MPHTQIQWHTE